MTDLFNFLVIYQDFHVSYYSTMMYNKHERKKEHSIFMKRSSGILMHISSLRKKLRERLGYDPIQTKIGQGYRLAGEEPI